MLRTNFSCSLENIGDLNPGLWIWCFLFMSVSMKNVIFSGLSPYILLKVCGLSSGMTLYFYKTTRSQIPEGNTS